ncbi:MAG: GAF domain-containing protein [Anaerolineales bacterium]|nr:GAF domain-containing protein [Anaerolineales bacterium]
MSVFQKASQNFLQNLSTQAEDLQSLREQVLKIVFRITSLFGAILFITNLIPAVQIQDWLSVGIFIFSYLGILLCTFIPGIPYSIRASIIIIIPIGLSLTDFVDLGLSGDGMVWLFTSAILTSILFGSRWTLFNWIIQAFILGTFFYLTTNDKLIISYLDYSLPLTWVDVALDYIFLGFLVTTGINILIIGLEKSLIATRVANETVQLNTSHLERRVNQLRTVAEISRAISAEATSENSIQRLADIIQERLNLYYVGVFLLSEDKKFAQLKAGTGEPGKNMLAQGHQLEIGGKSMINWCITNEQPRIALDIGQEAVRFENPHLPLTRSELALPLKTSTEVIGAVSIQSAEPQAFDQEDLTVLTGLADNLATAIVNLRLFQETQTQLQELNILYSASLSMYASVQSQDALSTIAQHMLDISGTQNYVVSSWDVTQDILITIFGFTAGEDVFQQFGQQYKLSDYPLTAQVLNQRFIATVRADDPQADPAEVALLREADLKSLLMVPLITHDKVIGLMELHDEINYRDFTPQQIRLVEALSAQAAVVIEMTNLFAQSRRAARNEQVVNQIATQFQQTLNVEEVMKTTILELSKALGLEEATIQLGMEETLVDAESLPHNGNTRNP